MTGLVRQPRLLSDDNVMEPTIKVFAIGFAAGLTSGCMLWLFTHQIQSAGGGIDYRETRLANRKYVSNALSHMDISSVSIASNAELKGLALPASPTFTYIGTIEREGSIVANCIIVVRPHSTDKSFAAQFTKTFETSPRHYVFSQQSIVRPESSVVIEGFYYDALVVVKPKRVFGDVVVSVTVN